MSPFALKYPISLGLLFCFFGGFTGSSLAQQSNDLNRATTEKIEQLISTSGASQALWSFSIRDEQGTALVDYESERFITPASNLKLLSSAAFLHILGSDFTFKTNMYAQGELSADSTLHGDLWIIGSGDPSIGKELYNNDPWYVFDSILSQLQQAGIKRIEGKVIGNDALFDDESYPPHWSYDDLSFYYAPELSALSFNRNCVDLTVLTNDKIGAIPRIEWFPLNTDYVTFINEQSITSPKSSYQEYYKRLAGSNMILLRSSLPQNYKEEESLSIAYPALFFADTFTKYARISGFEISGNPSWERSEIGIQDKDALKLVAIHESKPLRELMTRVNKNSDNFYAEMLTKKIAVSTLDIQGSTQAGVQIIRETLFSLGLDTTQIIMNDASGMAYTNLITTEQLSLLLSNARKQPWFNVYKNSLSVAGIDGTLRYRFGGTELQGNFQGKSGYIGTSRTLSGYLKTKSGKELTISFGVNNFPGSIKPLDKVHEAVLLYLYNRF